MVRMVKPLVLLVLGGACATHRPVAPPPLPRESATPRRVPEQARMHYLWGQILLASGDLDGASQAFGLVLLFDPESPWVRIAQGDVALAGGDLQRARDAWADATALDPTCAEAWFRLAQVELLLGASAEAVVHFRRAVDEGYDWRARAGLVDQLLRFGQSEEAAAALRDWASVPTADRWALGERGRRRLAAGDYEGGTEDLAAYLEMQPSDAVALELYLDAVSRTRRFGQALALLEKLQRALPADAGVASRAYELALRVGDTRRATSALLRLDRIRREADASVKLDLARSLLDLGQTVEAKLAVEEARVLDPTLPGLAVVRAQTFFRSGRVSEAIAALPPEDDRESVDVRFLRAELVRASGDGAAARRILEAGLEREPGSFVLLLAAADHAAADGDLVAMTALVERMGALSKAERARHRARLLAAHDQSEAAVAVLVEAHGAWPVDLGIVRDLGRLLVASGRASEAEAILSEATAQAAFDPDLLRLLASAQSGTGRVEPALATAGKILERNPDDAWALHFVGSAYAARGIRAAEAEAMLRRALDVEPGNAETMVSLGDLLVRTGRADEGQRLLRRAAQYRP